VKIFSFTIGDDLVSVLIICGLGFAAIWIFGFICLFIAVRKARRAFRSKGYLKVPSGTEWFHFLLKKHYEAFADPTARFFFGIAHFCMLASLIIFAAVVALVSCSYVLKMVSGEP
jgi:hypothetical protein